MLVVTLKRICVLEYLNRDEREKQRLYELDKQGIVQVIYCHQMDQIEA